MPCGVRLRHAVRRPERVDGYLVVCALLVGVLVGGALVAAPLAVSRTRRVRSPSSKVGRSRRAPVSRRRPRRCRPPWGPASLVGWFAEYNATGQVQVSDNVNGAWTRAPSATAFQNDTGDIALYYLANSKAASTLQVTTSAPAPAYLQGAIGDYSGTAVAGPLDQIVSNRGSAPPSTPAPPPPFPPANSSSPPWSPAATPPRPPPAPATPPAPTPAAAQPSPKTSSPPPPPPSTAPPPSPPAPTRMP